MLISEFPANRTRNASPARLQQDDCPRAIRSSPNAQREDEKREGEIHPRASFTKVTELNEFQWGSTRDDLSIRSDVAR